MKNINEKIISFLEQQTCATVCCIDEQGKPYCFSCYYVFNKKNGVLYFKSSAEAFHSTLLAKNPIIAGTIMPDKISKLITRGIQLQGEMLPQQHPLTKDAYTQYHKKFALALAIKGEVFTIQVNEIKMTDSKLGFRKKNYWQRHEKEISIGQ